ncbi:MAG: hypothetical protein PVJ28_08750, partial [Acidimicrobiia bacterium]
MEQLAQNVGIPAETLNNIIWSVVTVVLVLVGRHLARRLVHSNIETTDAAYRANKIINYVATAIFIVTAAFIWFDAF